MHALAHSHAEAFKSPQVTSGSLVSTWMRMWAAEGPRITGHPSGGPLPAEPTQAFAAAGAEAGPGHKLPATNGMPRRRRLPQPAALPLSSVRPPCCGRLMCAAVGHEFMFKLTEAACKAGHFRRCIVSSRRTGKKKSGNNTNCRGHIADDGN